MSPLSFGMGIGMNLPFNMPFGMPAISISIIEMPQINRFYSNPINNQIKLTEIDEKLQLTY